MVRDNDTTLVTLRQLAPIYVAFGIPEQNLTEVRRLNAAGQLTVDVSTDKTNTSGSGNASSSVKGGHLVFIDNVVDATTGTIRLKAAFPNTDNTLWPGEFVNVRLRLGLETSRTVIPESSVQQGLDGKYVWLIQSGTASTVPITVSRTYRPPSGSEQAVIGSGIKSGDMVVTEGQLRLTAGAPVALLNTPGAGPSISNSTPTP
jgi:multidrug efflux system membrane fusion protein